MRWETLPEVPEMDRVVITDFDMVVLAHEQPRTLISGFDTTPGPPISRWRQWWRRIRGLWPLYRCRHDRRMG